MKMAALSFLAKVVRSVQGCSENLNDVQPS